MRPRRLEGLTAIITGASSGIGAGVAKVLATQGANVVVNYRSHAEEAKTLVHSLQSHGVRAIAIEADVSKEADVHRLFEQSARELGHVDLVIANSGIQQDAPVAELTLEQWQAVIDVNLTGQFLTCREAIATFRRQPLGARRTRGAIVCMSSVHERIPWAGHVNYAASKGGVKLLMQSLAQEVAPEHIRVNAVAPGAIKTPINREAWETKAQLEKLLKLIPSGRIGEPDDVGHAVAFLCSDEADYITGTTLFVDGGMSLYPGFEANG